MGGPESAAIDAVDVVLGGQTTAWEGEEMDT